MDGVTDFFEILAILLLAFILWLDFILWGGILLGTIWRG